MYLRLISALLLCAAALSDEIKQDEGVLVLTNTNFDSAITQNEFILVEFYAPWCGHCKELAPEYAKAATKLNDASSNIKLGKVDATVETDLAEKFKLRGYPTLKFFRNGQPIDYTGGRKADDIVSWLVKKTGSPAKALSSVDEVKAFIEDGVKVVVVGFFSDESSPEAKEYLQTAGTIDESPFGISSDPAVLKEYNVEKNKVIIFKKFDEPPSETEEFGDSNRMRDWILTESLPLIIEFNHENAQKIFGGAIKSHLLLFLSKKEGHGEQLLPHLKELSKKYRERLLFVSIDVDEPDHNRIVEFFGIKSSHVPTMRIIFLEDEMTKYKPDSDADFSAENVEKFVQSYVDGTLKEHLLAEDLPEDWDKHPVKVLVATNFDEVAFDKSKDVIVEFYAPWCGHCKKLEPVYEKLAKNFEGRDDILIAKIDATANELAHTKISSFPIIKMYKKDDNEAIQYEGQRTLEGLTKFIETRGEYGSGPEADELPEEEEEGHEEDHPKDEL